ncbi:MAG TPA: glycine cleavage system protein H [Bacteroidota bacterium]|nr:glycine cleavage system protein H [Bacteroidota bacterium]
MVAILVVVTILLVLGIEFFRKRTVQQNATVATAEQFAIPKGYFISNTHTWLEMVFSGEARIGIDDFAQKVIGRVEHINVVSPGTEVKRGEPIATVYHGTQTLTIAAPVSGKIIKTNQRVLAEPQLLNTDPYIGGWITLIAPNNISSEIKLLTIAEDAANWLKKEIARFRDFIKVQTQTGTLAPVGVTMLDGGVPLSGALEHCADTAWQEFQKEFLNAQ